MGDILCDRHVRQKRPPSPVPTCVSMKSDRSKDYPLNFQNEDDTMDQGKSMKQTHVKGMLGRVC